MPPTITTTDYQVNIQAGQANQQQFGLPLSQVLASAVSVTRTTSSRAGPTLQISVVATGFTFPTATPVSGHSHLGVASATVADATDSMTLTSSVTNATPPGGGFTTQTITGPELLSGSAKSDTFTTITSLTAPFAISQILTFRLNSLGDVVNYASATTLSSVPEPSSLAFASLAGLSFIGYGLRRRKAMSV